MKDRLEIDFYNLKEFYDRIKTRKYNEMSERFRDKIKGNPVIYKVYIKDFGDFEYGLTVINPGKIGKEFYMTKGHKHKKPVGELYILIKGKGTLLIKKGSVKRGINLRKNKVYSIPKNAGHRLINTGKEELQVLTIYSKKAGQDYNFSF